MLDGQRLVFRVVFLCGYHGDGHNSVPWVGLVPVETDVTDLGMISPPKVPGEGARKGIKPPEFREKR